MSADFLDKMERRIRALKCSETTRSHIACIVWWDYGGRRQDTKAWMKDLRDAYSFNATPTREEIETGLRQVGYEAKRARNKAASATHKPPRKGVHPEDSPLRGNPPRDARKSESSRSA